MTSPQRSPANDDLPSVVPFRSFVRAAVARDRRRRRATNAGRYISREGLLLAAILGVLARSQRKRDKAFLQRINWELESLQHQLDGASGLDEARWFYDACVRLEES